MQQLIPTRIIRSPTNVAQLKCSRILPSQGCSVGTEEPLYIILVFLFRDSAIPESGKFNMVRKFNRSDALGLTCARSTLDCFSMWMHERFAAFVI